MGIHGSELSFRSYKGEEIQEVLGGLARLRLRVFYDYPYLYEGSLAYEEAYLRTYIQCADSLLFTVFDGSEMVGATTCLPLVAETAEVRAPFEDRGYHLSSIVYFGESIVLMPYRGGGLGKRFFQEREAHARTLKGIEEVYFCGVRRPEDHALRPAAYRPLDSFWQSLGYARKEDLVSYFSWKDRNNEEEDAKPMDYWFKKI